MDIYTDKAKYRPSKLYIGIDGGGSKTGISVIDADGRLLFSGTFGPSNLLNRSEFEENVLKMFRDVFLDLKEVFRVKTELYITAGFAGTSSEDYAQRFTDVFRKASLGYDVILEYLHVTSDALLALNIYFSNRPGLLLISGTGSICYGKNGEGVLFRTGGFGYIIDDAGSGFWFGREAVRAALNSYYNPDSKTALEDLVKEHYQIAKTDDIYNIIYGTDPKSAVASASELVFKAAELGCKTAVAIIENGAEELIKLVLNCSELIGKKAPFVVLHGSVFRQERLVGLIRKKLINDMNIYISDKRIDLEAANMMLDQKVE